MNQQHYSRQASRWQPLTLAGLLAVSAFALLGFTAAGPAGLLTLALTTPFVVWGARIFTSSPNPVPLGRLQSSANICSTAGMKATLDKALVEYQAGSSNAACFVVHLPTADNTRDALNLLRSALRHNDTVLRIDDQNLAVCVLGIRRFDVENGLMIAERIRSVVGQVAGGPSDQAIYREPGLAIGFCLASRTPKEDGATMLQAATRAMQEAKTRSPSFICAYSKSLGGVAVSDDLVPQISAALQNGEIQPYFQAQVDAVTGDITGVEALARWLHPQIGLIPPSNFLSAVKSAGLWNDMTETILNQSLAQLTKWDTSGLSIPQVGVNFSEADLSQPDMVDRVQKALDQHGLLANRLAIEVVESVTTEAHPRIKTTVQALSDLGCTVDLDDFGTGHAAISTLKSIAADRIKIDRSFIIKIDQDPEQQAMLETIVMMAKRMGLSTLAEGVETPEERAIVSSAGCNAIQGFGISRPMPPAKFQAWANHYNKQGYDPWADAA